MMAAALIFLFGLGTADLGSKPLVLPIQEKAHDAVHLLAERCHMIFFNKGTQRKKTDAMPLLRRGGGQTVGRETKRTRIGVRNFEYALRAFVLRKKRNRTLFFFRARCVQGIFKQIGEQ